MKKHRRSMAAIALDSLRRLLGRGAQKRRKQSRREFFRFETLEERLPLTHSPTDHVHAELKIFLEGQEVVIPPDIGLTAAQHFNPHTHDFTGTLHMGEGGPAGLGTETRLVTLDDFFDVWRTTNVGGPSNNPSAVFDSTHIMDRTSNATKTVRMYVNGQLNTQFEAYTPHDGDKIVISYEPTSTPVGSPMLEPIANQTVLIGSPLFLALDGFDPQGQNLTYTVTSSNSNIQASVLTGNRSMRITVPNFGEMEFQLFDNFVPRVTNAIASLVNAGFYDGLTFHRIIDNFMIQGGSHDGSGGPNPNVADFDDQFHFDLQHNSTGLLSMAKSLDDTNDTQFFITDAPARHLDFNHSIFGRLTDGNEVRNAINSVPTGQGDVPLTPVSMSDVEIFTDNENGVLMLKAAPGATSGSSTITVTVTDSEGKTFVRTFVATIGADTSNGNPFLSDISPVQAASGQSTQFQLVGNDVEGNAIFYNATKIGTVDYQVSVNNNTGLVTVTPPAGFVGTFQVQVSAKAASQQGTSDPNQQITDVQIVTVNVSTAAPASVDLVAASDTGISNTDNFTKASALSFLVSGVTSGATVKLYAGNAVVAQDVATGSTITLTFGSSLVGEGTHQFSATQTISGQEGAHTSNLPVTFDLTPPPAFSSTAPSEATVGVLLSYNAQNPEEGTTNFRYALSSAPAGVSIDATTGQMTWTPAQAQVGSHNFAISATDAAGNATLQSLSITVAEPVVHLAEIALQVLNTSGQAVTNLQLNQNFFLVGRVRDLRGSPEGVFSFFTDITFNSNLAIVTGPIQFGTQFSNATTGTSTPGLLDEVGGISNSITPIGGGFKELFRVPMRATGGGTLQFVTGGADLDVSEVTLYGHDPEVEHKEITFGTASVGVALTFTPKNDTATVGEDSTNNTINVLANDTIQPGSGNVLSIASVGSTSSGGTVTIASDAKSLRYSPATNFVGTETFTYIVQNQNGASSSATVTVTVNNVNDPPSAASDTFTVNEDSSNNTLNVLANDSASPDTGETLRVTAVGAGSQQGTITIVSGGTAVRYTPKANFLGTETFTYTIGDGHGGTATATVSVTVGDVNDNPVATNDTATVQEDTSTDTTINVLTNDTTGPDTGETLSVTAVGTPNHGGTVSIAPGATSVNYKPAPNFQGTESFTYTISDGHGGTATATVTVTVSNTNDAPTANNDTLDAFKNTTTTLDVLANDVSAPDPTEAFIITAVTQGDQQNGTVAISPDGTRVLFTPTTGYLGPYTFTYTMRDPGGLTSTATVNLTVRDFIPSVLGGRVFIDRDNDGVADTNESGIGGVEIKLTGTATSGGPVTMTVNSAADGSYKFENLPPGTFTIQQTQPQFLKDGKDTSSLASATVSGNDKFTVQLAQGTTALSQLQFGERGKTRQLTRMREFFASNLRNNVLAAIPYTAPTTSDANFPALVSPAWQNQVGTQWSQFHDFKFAVSNNNQQLRIQVKNTQNQTLQATVSLSDQAKVLDLGTQNGQRLVRLLGSPTAFNFQPAAEGEADSAMDAALAAVTDRTDGGLLGTLASNDSLDQAATDAALTSTSDWRQL
jgi:cyclophilin family peptidyl-prolyl cis-trans isomerase